MPSRNIRNRRAATAGLMAYLDDREDEMLDAVITAAALVARADGRIEPVEAAQTVDFLDRHEVLSMFRRGEIIDAFEHRLRELREPGGIVAALYRLRRHAVRPMARLMIEAGEEVAIADCRLDPREQHVLDLIRKTLEAGPSPSAPAGRRPGTTK